jgi:Trk K+ transport system NAD-binding subunit/Kef-type K+ transport system membrane component KefB
VQETLIYFIAFVVVCLASHRIGTFFSAIKLPYITGYLFAGALAGSFGLNFVPTEAVEQLRFVDQLSLAIIAFVAGSELFLKELLNRLRSIAWIIGAIVATAVLIIGISVYTLTAFIPFTQDMAAGERLAVALLGATVLLALSPPSTIAVIKEVRARGPFTRLVLGVTVTMDVVIIVFFAINSSLAEALLTGVGLQLSFVPVLLLDLALAISLGYLAGRLLQATMRLRGMRGLKISLILALGYSIYALAGFVKAYSLANFPFEIYIEPLLIAMIAGFYITNFTAARDEFADILHDIGPVVYVAFFTLTGISLKLDLLLATLGIALLLFLARGLAIMIGSYAGASIAGEDSHVRRLVWLGLITQAGIALGLAREVSVAFPALGDAFATLIISVIVLNEIFGPLFLKAALRRAEEANEPVSSEPDMKREVVILGIEGQSLALARQLTNQNWHVRLADTDASHVERLAAEDVDEQHISEISAEHFRDLFDSGTDAVVAMLERDEENLRACMLAYEKFGVRRIVVRLTNQSLRERFVEIGAIVVDPASAMVSLLDQAVRAPHSTSMLLHPDPDVVQITVTNSDLEGALVRDLRLPNDVLLLEIIRDGQAMVPHGYTRIRRGDEITAVGRPESLEEVILTLGF